LEKPGTLDGTEVIIIDVAGPVELSNNPLIVPVTVPEWVPGNGSVGRLDGGLVKLKLKVNALLDAGTRTIVHARADTLRVLLFMTFILSFSLTFEGCAC
jgi:hypothetical protein